MKRLMIIIFSLIVLSIPFVEAKENNSIEHIGNDIIITYNGETIIIYDKTLDGKTQKCPVGYHIGSAEDFSNMIKLWYSIKGINYKWMELKHTDFYKIEETLDIAEQCGGTYSWNQRDGGDKDCISSLKFDPGLHLFELVEYLYMLSKKNGSSTYVAYKTSTKGANNSPYIFVYLRKPGSQIYFSSSAHLRTCTTDNSIYSCKNVDSIRCFKNDENTITDNGFSKEYNEAYVFAYNNKITTMPTIEQANMTGEIIRAEIAKMLSNWVKKFGYYADSSIPCKFTDTSSVKGDLATAIIESCQYGIMGQGINQFRPYDKITKAEVATAVSRILRGPKYDGGTPFYINHVRELKNNGIILDDGSINSNELRGNVMATLMRANKILEYNSIDCENIEYILACTDNEENCPEKCRNN